MTLDPLTSPSSSPLPTAPQDSVTDPSSVLPIAPVTTVPAADQTAASTVPSPGVLPLTPVSVSDVPTPVREPTPSIETMPPVIDPTVIPQEGIGLPSSSHVPDPVTPLEAAQSVPATSEPVVMAPLVSEEMPFEAPAVPQVTDTEAAAVPAAEPTAPVIDTPTIDPLAPSTEASAEVPAEPTESTEPDTPADDGEKSPLDILEEILAGAEAEKNKKTEEEQAKIKADEEFAAQLAAKKAVFDEEAKVKLAANSKDLEAAKVQREQVEADLIQQGKVDPAAAPGEDTFAIRQLGHESTDE